MKKANKSKLTPPMKILIVEDDDPLCFLIALWIAKALGVDLHFSSNGDEALKAYSKGGPYDVVVTDLAHPGPSGLDLVNTLRQKNPKQAIAVFTGATGGSELRSLQQLGIPVQTKPCIGEDFIQVLETAMASRKKKAARKTVQRRMGTRA